MRSTGSAMLDVPVSQAERRRTVSAPYALPAGCGTLLLIGAIAAGTHGAVSSGWVLVLAAIVVAVTGLFAEPGVTLFVAMAAWFTTAGFSSPPYAQLHVTWLGGARAALILAGCALCGLAAGAGMRWWSSSYTLYFVDVPGAGHADEYRADDSGAAQPDGQALVPGQPLPAIRRPRNQAVRPAARPGQKPHRTGGIAGRRQLAGVLLVLLFPLLTAALLPASRSLSL